MLRPDGSALATQAWGDDLTRTPGDDDRGSRSPQAVIIDLKSPPRVRTAILGRANQTGTGRSVWGNMVWLNADRIGFFPAAGSSGTHLRQLLARAWRTDNWAASTSLLMGGVIVGLGEEG